MKRLLFVLMFVLAAQTTSAAIARDTCSTGTGSGATLTISHTATGADLFMTVVILDTVSVNVTNVDYNSVALTASPDNALVPAVGVRRSLNYYLNGPSTGTHNLVITSGGGGSIWAEVCTYTGVAAAQPDARGTITTSLASPTTGSVTVSGTATVNAWTIFLVTDDSGTQAASTGSNLNGCSASTIACIYDSNGAVGATGAHSMAVTTNATGSQSGFVLSLAPVTGGGAVTPCRRSLLGVGCDELTLGSVSGTLSELRAIDLFDGLDDVPATHAPHGNLPQGVRAHRGIFSDVGAWAAEQGIGVAVAEREAAGPRMDRESAVFVACQGGHTAEDYSPTVSTPASVFVLHDAREAR